MAEANRSVEAFSTAVAAIYDCALNPDAWQQALRRVGGDPSVEQCHVRRCRRQQNCGRRSQ
jgi:hypothetical protein